MPGGAKGDAVAPVWARRITGYLDAPDGTKLRYSVLLPAEEGRFPVIINYSGYDPGSIGGAAYLQDNTAMSPGLDRTLLEHGYAVMGVNARGTACSEGKFDFLGPDYGRDGAAAVEFAAAQPWSTGAVGMANWSWAGMSQLLTASHRPSHLKAIAPGMVLGDPRLDSWAPGGVPAPAFINEWRKFLHSRWAAAAESAQAEGDGKCLQQVTANLAYEDEWPITRFVAQHPFRDDWIQERQIRDRTHLIEVPILSMEAFQDDAVTSREGYYHETLDPKLLWLVQSNGPHNLYESLHFRRILIAFFDHFVKGEANGFDRRPRLNVWMDASSNGKGWHPYFEQGKPGWEFSLPSVAPDVVPLAFALTEDGRLVEGGTPKGEPDSYRYPVPGPAVDVGFEGDAWSDQHEDWRAGSLAYTSAPLGRDILTYGSASADIWLSARSSDVDLQVTLTEVRPDGQEVFIQRGWLRASNRAIDKTRSTPVRPVLVDTRATVRTLNPGEPVLARVEINKFAYVFHKGARLRLWIDTPSFWGGYGFDYYAVPTDVQVWHDADHPSQLVIGELPGIAIPVGMPPCGTLLKQPCRPDPLGAVKAAH
jgi:predicted acyl esterase